MRSSKSLLSWIAAGALLALLAGCNEDSPAKPAPNREGDGTTAFSATSTSSPSSYAPTFNSNTQLAMDNIAGQSQTVKGAVDGLKMANTLVAELTALLAELQAEAPDPAAYKDNPEDYQKALAAYQQKVAAAQQKLAQAQAAVQKAVAAVEAAVKELQKLQSTDLPAAQRQDAAEMERYFEEEKKKLEAQQQQNVATLEAVKTETDTGGESAAETETKPAPKKTGPFGTRPAPLGGTGKQAASDPRLSGGSTPAGSGLPTDD